MGLQVTMFISVLTLDISYILSWRPNHTKIDNQTVYRLDVTYNGGDKKEFLEVCFGSKLD